MDPGEGEAMKKRRRNLGDLSYLDRIQADMTKESLRRARNRREVYVR